MLDVLGLHNGQASQMVPWVQGYTFKIIHEQGKTNVIADALGRRLHESENVQIVFTEALTYDGSVEIESQNVSVDEVVTMETDEEVKCSISEPNTCIFFRILSWF